mgnify:CR=1 FL=1
MERVSKENYYLDIAEAVLERSTCIRRMYGAVIVKDDEIISTGYNGAPRGRANCNLLGFCAREKLNIKSGEKYELCRSVHAEQNAIISASRSDILGSTMYLVGKNFKDGEYVVGSDCCSMCKRVVINSGVSRVVMRVDKEHYKVINVDDWIGYDEVLEEKVKPMIKEHEAK